MRKCIIGAGSARTTDVVTGLTTTVLGWNKTAPQMFQSTVVKFAKRIRQEMGVETSRGQEC